MAKKQAYVVLVGVKPGVYTNWLDVTQNTTGVPHAQFQGFTYYEEAVKYFEREYRRGTTRAVKKLPPPPQDEDDDEEPKGAGGKGKEPEGRNDGRRQRRRELEDSPRAAGSVQTPSKGSPSGRAARDAQIAAALASARKNKIGPSASSPSVIASERRQQERTSRHAALARSATEPAYRLQPRVQDSPIVSSRTYSRRTRRTVELPSPEPDVRPRTCVEPETQSRTKTGTASESRGPTSDIPTNETRTTNRFTNSPGLSTPPHPYRYAQSLSYASSPASLASSDLRTHISSPSSFGTRYFPEDWLRRIGPGRQRRQSGHREGRRGGDDRSSVLSTCLSEYATAPNTPEMESNELEDNVEDMHDVTMASPNPSARDRVGWSEPSSSSSRSAVTRSKTWPSAPSPPPATATATEVISSPSATSTPRRTGSARNSASVNDHFSPSLASVPQSSPPPKASKKSKKKTTTRVTRSLSEAQVQTDSPPPTRRRKNQEAGVQTTPPGASPPKRQHLDNQVQTSSVASPQRESTAVGDMPVRPLPGAFPCACEHPEYACINCGQRPRVEGHNAPPAARHSRSSRPPSTITATASPALSELSSASSLPAPFGTPASAVRSSARTRSSSSRSHGRGHTSVTRIASPEPSAPSSPAPSQGTPASAVPSSVVSMRSTSSRSHGGHTPIMGPSETRAYGRSPTARIQESLMMMSFSEAALGVGADAVVVHDVSFDPRSPIQRGTNIPAGTSGSAVRPSPAMAPVPMGSLGLLFPS